MGKLIVADSSAIISLAINCMSSVLAELGAQIAVTQEVYEEIVARPQTSKRYALESIRIKKLFKEGVLVVREPDHGSVKEILDVSNSIYRIHKHRINLIHAGEAAALALSKEMEADAFLIDERTMRMLLEDPEGLRLVLCGHICRNVKIDNEKLARFRSITPKPKIIRSSEVIVVAYEKGILGKALGDKRKEALLAALYALKFSGCAISWDEIDEYSRIL